MEGQPLWINFRLGMDLRTPWSYVASVTRKLSDD